METIEDIVREMRKMGENYAKSESNDCRYVAYWLGSTFADRLVAVAESETTIPTCKESLQVGNAAAMRESAKATMKFIESAIVNGKVSVEALTTLQNIVSKALAAPPRNCDKYRTPKSAWIAHFYDCAKRGEKEFDWGEYIDWLFATAKGVNENA